MVTIGNLGPKKARKRRDIDWRTPAAYPCPLSPEGWAWEFLRRNSDYVADWQRFAAARQKWGDFDGALSKCPTLDIWECNPPALPGETEPQWTKRTGGKGRAMGLSAAVAQRWGLLALPRDPSMTGTPTTSLVFDLNALAIRVCAGWWPSSSRSRLSLSAHEAAITFDLALPITPQIDRAKKYLKETQTWLKDAKGLKASVTAPKYSADSLIEYLRILDAQSAGATPEELVSALYPTARDEYPELTGKQRFAKARRVAKALRDGGYRELVLLTSSKPGKITRS